MHSDDNTRSFVPISSGTTVNQYRIIERIGSGGMGEVYLAVDTNLDRRVALKFIPAALANDEAVKARFVREAKAAAKLHHPHIVTVHDVGDYNGRPYIAMEYVAGKRLDEIAKAKAPDFDTVVEYAIQLCQGLGEAHRDGVIHRDIKSANIALDRSGRTRILDFGLAAMRGYEKLTKTGSTLGTVAYMSPEQVSGREVDHRSDLFSLGIVLYELITGRTPFKRDSEGATLKAIMQDEPEPMTRYRASVPEQLQNIVSKLLEKDREVRYQSAEGALADLKKMLYDSRGSSSSTAPTIAKSRKGLIAGAVALVVVAAVVSWQMLPGGPDTNQSIDTPVLAVLPFHNLGAEEDNYFSAGIADEIRSRLVSVEGLTIISPSSTERYENTDKPIEQIGRELGADFVLEASIRWDKSGEVDRIRIVPRLTKTSDGYLIWADSYERQLVRIFDVQTQIAAQIVTALGLTLLNPEGDAPAYAPTDNMEAYTYYLRGIDLIAEGIWIADVPKALAMFDSAVALDPDFAVAWAQKSQLHTQKAFGYIIDDDGYDARQALKSAERALELDPLLPDARIALGMYYNLLETDYEAAMEQFSLAKSEVSSNPALLEGIAHVKMRQGKWQEALEGFRKALRVDPLSGRRYFWLSQVNCLLRNFDQAEQYTSRGLSISPDNGDLIYEDIQVNLLRYGSIHSPEDSSEIVRKPQELAGVASLELAPSWTPGLWRFIIDEIDVDVVLRQYRKLKDQRSPSIFHLHLGQIFDLTGQEDSARLHYDSTRILLRQMLDDGSKDFHIYPPLGFAYAFLGMADSAIWAGQVAKEALSVETCHW